MLINVSRYPTQVDISIISNEPERLKLAMQSWKNTGVSIHRPRGNLTKPFDLAHEHRAYMKEAFNTTSIHSGFGIVTADDNCAIVQNLPPVKTLCTWRLSTQHAGKDFLSNSFMVRWKL